MSRTDTISAPSYDCHDSIAVQTVAADRHDATRVGPERDETHRALAKQLKSAHEQLTLDHPDSEWTQRAPPYRLL